MTENDRRLIEDYLPIEKMSAEGSREKSIRKGHISTLHPLSKLLHGLSWNCHGNGLLIILWLSWLPCSM